MRLALRATTGGSERDSCRPRDIALIPPHGIQTFPNSLAMSIQRASQSLLAAVVPILITTARPAIAQGAVSPLEAGKSALAAGNADSAVSALRAGLKQNDGSSVYHFWLGQAYAKQAEHGNMISKARAVTNMKDEWERAVALDSNNYDAHRGLFDFAVGSPPLFGGGESRANRERDIMLRLRPYESSLLFARDDQRHARTAEAVALLRPITAQYPDSVAPQQLLIGVLEDAHDQDAAWRALDDAVRRFGKKPVFEFLLGRGAAISNTRVTEGTAALRRLIEAPAADASAYPAGAAHYRLGMILERAGHGDEARRLYQQALQLDARNDNFKAAFERLTP